MPTLDEVFNFAIATLSQGYSSSATSIQVATGEGSRFPTTPCNLVWWNATTYPNPADDPNREIVRMTARNTDVFTVIRGQETGKGGLAASAKNVAGVVYKIALISTSKLRDDLEAKAVDIGAQTIYATEKGAKGDGTTDDTTAFVNGLAPASLFIIPPGTYVIDGDLLPHSNLTIQGAGMGATILKLKASSTKSMFKSTALVDRCTFRDLTIDGNEANCPSGLDGIYLEKTTRLTLKNVEIIRCKRDAVFLSGASGGSCKYLTLEGCHFTECVSNLVEIQNRSNDNMGNRITGCHFSTPAFGVSSYRLGLVAWGPVVVTGCTFEGVATIAGGIDLQADDGTFGNGAHGSVISNVRILGTSHATNVCFGLVQRAKRCRLSNVTIEGPDIGFEVLATNGDDNAFENCVAFNCGDRGFRIAGDRNTLIGCHIEGSTKSIEITSAAADTSLLGNFIGGTSGNRVQNDSTTTHARNNRNWKTHGVFKHPADPGEACDGGTDTFSVVLDLDVTPLPENFRVTMFRFSGTNLPAAREIVIVGTPSATQVDVLVQQTAAAATTFYKIGVEVDALP